MSSSKSLRGGILQAVGVLCGLVYLFGCNAQDGNAPYDDPASLPASEGVAGGSGVPTAGSGGPAGEGPSGAGWADDGPTVDSAAEDNPPDPGLGAEPSAGADDEAKREPAPSVTDADDSPGPDPSTASADAIGDEEQQEELGFSEVSALLEARCATSGCHHEAGGFTHVDLRNDSGLHGRLLASAPQSTAAACRNRALVVPGDPDGSLLIAKVEAASAPRAGCGSRMPRNCGNSGNPCLAAAQVELLRAWIANGASAD